MENTEILLGQAIKLARMSKNLSQEKLAELVDITPTHLKHIESGHRNPSVGVLIKLVKILQFSLDELIFPEKDLPSLNLQKAQLMLRDCDERQLDIILATLGAMNPPDKKGGN